MDRQTQILVSILAIAWVAVVAFARASLAGAALGVAAGLAAVVFLRTARK